jgi:flavin reductase (DIM6/NTAB) family NADH-FMN oxidoreductase RutF
MWAMQPSVWKKAGSSPAPWRGFGMTKIFRSTQKLKMTLDTSQFRQAMGCFATGVTIITVALDGEVHGEVHGKAHGEVHGMTANAFASVSLDPPLVLVCVDHQASTHAHLYAKKRFGINVLSEGQRKISEYYARPERTHERAEAEAGARFDRTQHGTPVLQGSLAYLECRLHSAQDAGDHTIFIAEVEDIVVREGEPLLFFRGKYRKVGEEVER